MTREIVIVLADIHANLPALQAVLEDARTWLAGYDLHYWFLGDLFGRGPQPFAVWAELLALQPAAIVAGNHDLAISRRNSNTLLVMNGSTTTFSTGPYNDVDWSILVRHRQELASYSLPDAFETASETATQNAAEWISRWPFVLQVHPGIYLVHGGLETPFDPPAAGGTLPADWWDRWAWDYVKTPPQVRHTFDGVRWLAATQPAAAELHSLAARWAAPELILAGHYHHQRLYHAGVWHINDGAAGSTPPIQGHWYPLATTVDEPTFISPGSVGFPTEQDSRDACYAVLLLEDGRATHVQFRAVPYNRADVRKMMRQEGYPAETVRRLCLDGECDEDDIAEAHTLVR